MESTPQSAVDGSRPVDRAAPGGSHVSDFYVFRRNRKILRLIPFGQTAFRLPKGAFLFR